MISNMLVQVPELLEQDWLVHAFTTRQGGVSAPPYDTLNMSFSRPDDPAAVRENRRRVCAALGVTLDDVAVAGQIHGVHVARVGAEDRGRGAHERDSLLPPADGLVSAAPGVVLLGCFADCVPLLLADPVRRAVGVAHAGWRGTVADMAGAAVRGMEELLGSRPGDLIAVVGPAIGPCCYEVGEEVIAAARSSYHDTLGEVGLVRGGRLYFDLWRANELALSSAGVGRVVRTDLCTACNRERFFSHRADRGATGRFAALIGVKV